MKIIERIEVDQPRGPRRRPIKPSTMAAVAGALIVAFVIAGILLTGPLSRASFGSAFFLTLWLGMISGAFAVDRRRRRNELLGR